MSIELMAQVWKLDLPRDEKIIALAFADHANDDGTCFPSVRRIAWKCGYSERSVQRKIQALIEIGILTPVDNVQGGRGMAVTYLVTPSAGTDLPPFKGANLSARNGDGGRAKGDGTGSERTPEVAPQPPGNHQESSEPPLPPAGAKVITPEDAAPEWMHAQFENALGLGRPLTLTPNRRRVYRALFVEQLKGTPDPVLAFRCILKAISTSDWHKQDRSWQMPESLFRTPDKREVWVIKAVDRIERLTTRVSEADDFAAAYRAREAAKNGRNGT